MGIPNPKNIIDSIKNIIIVLDNDGTGCHAFNICCLN
jgi:hypothetical protein